jgi:hypothetical protein
VSLRDTIEAYRAEQQGKQVNLVLPTRMLLDRRKLVPAGFNPVRGIDKYPEKGRERFLSAPELGRLGFAKLKPLASGHHEADCETRTQRKEQAYGNRPAPGDGNPPVYP